MLRLRPRSACLSCLAVLLVLPGGLRAEDGYGSVKGQFVLGGDVPQPKVVIAKGDAKVKDPQVCAAQEQLDDSLVVDRATKGVANIVVYLRSVDAVHPKRQAVPEAEKTLVFDQKNCRFTPHVLSVRNGQKVLVKSDDPVPHNTHTHPFKNTELNFVVRANDREGVPVTYDESEFLPVKVNCDLHPHMLAYWVVLDHPYFAVTDAQGRFEIKDLPEGEYDFIVWHERVGYLDKKVEEIQDALNVEVFSDESEDLGQIEVPLNVLQP